MSLPTATPNLLANLPSAKDTPDHFPGLSTEFVRIPAPPEDPTLDLTIHCRRYVPSESITRAVVLLHGHPQSHHTWHRVVKLLREDEQTRGWELIIPDVRGHGKSSKPPVAVELGAPKDGSGKDRMTKRTIARDTVELMKHFGHDKFSVLAHDRGARVTHRLALDYPEKVQGIVLLDIAPSLDMFNTADQHLAKVYWHWFFLLQPYPYPEQMILNAPHTYLELLVTRFLGSEPKAADAEPLHPPALLAVYLEQLTSPLSVHATVEDYRASGPGGADLLLDAEDDAAGKRIQCPTGVLWGAKGVVQRMYGGGEEIWKKRLAEGVTFSARAVESGHYVPEERPEEVVAEAKKVFV